MSSPSSVVRSQLSASSVASQTAAMEIAIDLDNNNTPALAAAAVARPSLSFLDSYLTAWIFLSMFIGVLLGALFPSLSSLIGSMEAGNTNVPIAIGLILMMIPPFCRVKYDEIFLLVHAITRANSSVSSSLVQRASSLVRVLKVSMVFNWLVGPLLMFFLAVACLPDQFHYCRGLLLIGVARCIAMVVVWNTLAGGNQEYCAIIVLINTMFQLVFYTPLAYLLFLFLSVFPFSVGSSNSSLVIPFSLIVESVAIYLGIPFLVGFAIWWGFNRSAYTSAEVKRYYKDVFIPRVSPVTLGALLFTILFMFCLKGSLILTLPLDILRVAIPLLLYFLLMFLSVYFFCYWLGVPLTAAIPLSFTAASNNFELAIAVAIAVFGLDSPEALAGVVGPLVEVPVMLGLVHGVKLLNQRWPLAVSDPAAERLDELEAAIADADDGNDKVRVLFLCTGNSCRSHMAEGWAQRYHGSWLAPYSAGTEPTPGQPGPINPYAIRAMKEAGIDIADHRSKNIDDFIAGGVRLDFILSVCDNAAASCPAYPRQKTGPEPVRLHHQFDDPPRLVRDQGLTDDEQVMGVYRRVCKEIEEFIRDELPKHVKKGQKQSDPPARANEQFTSDDDGE